MMVGVMLTILNQDASVAMRAQIEEEVPLTSPDPQVNGGRALMRLREIVPDALERVEGQAQALGVTEGS
jgi:hypothetical protein